GRTTRSSPSPTCFSPASPSTPWRAPGRSGRGAPPWPPECGSSADRSCPSSTCGITSPPPVGSPPCSWRRTVLSTAGVAETPSSLVPGLWSALPLKPEWQALLFDSRDPFLASLYLGLPALGLVAGAAAGAPHPARRFLLVLGGAALLLALGRHAPFFDGVVF